MCSFSPDDSRLLVSGVDEELRQFDLRKGLGVAPKSPKSPKSSALQCLAGSRFPVPCLGSSINYRRSLYVAGGDVVGSSAGSAASFYQSVVSGRGCDGGNK